MSSEAAPLEVSCSAGCKRSTALDPESGMPAAPGWEYLSITGRWRCPACYRELADVNTNGGAVQSNDAPDTLPRDSIGALKKLPEPVPLHEKVRP